MNHYELIFIVNPQQSKESKLFDKCKDQISAVGGELHRAEDIGLRDLSYQIDDCSKGHNFLLNFECEPNKLKELETLFKFNESILRSLISLPNPPPPIAIIANIKNIEFSTTLMFKPQLLPLPLQLFSLF